MQKNYKFHLGKYVTSKICT